MGISRVGGSSDYTTDLSGTPLSVAWPSGHQVGDFAIVVGIKNDDAALLTMDSTGWTLNGPNSSASAADDRAWASWLRFAESGSEPNVEISSTQATRGAAAMIVLRGVDQSGDGLDVSPRGGVLLSNNENPTPTSQTSVTDNVAVVVVQGAVNETNGVGLTSAGAPTGYTLDTDATNISNTGVQTVVAYLLDAGAAGLKAPGAFNNTSSGDTPSNATFTFLVRFDPGTTYAPAGDASGTGTSQTPGTSVSVSAGSASATGTAHDAMVPSVAYGGVGTGSTSATSINLGWPSGIAVNDYVLSAIANGNASGSTAVSTAGSDVELANGENTDGTFGDNTGPRRATVFGIEAAGGETGTVTYSHASADANRVIGGIRYRFSTASSAWDVVAYSGNDSVAGTAISVDFSSVIVAAGDLLFWLWAGNDDTIAISGHAFTASGITFGDVIELVDVGQTTGNDIRIMACYVPVATGSGTVTVTASSSSLGSGGAVLVRLRGTDSSGTVADAGSASGTGTAQTPSTSVQPTSGSSAATGTSETPNAALSASAAVGEATGTSSDATNTIASGTGVAEATGAAAGPGGSALVTAETTTSGTGTALDVVPTRAGNPTPDAATGTGAAGDSTSTIAPVVESASSAGTSETPSLSVAPVVESASSTGSAHDATVSTAVVTNADAELATATGTSNGATTFIAPGSGVSTGSGAASGSGAATGPTAAVAATSGSAAGTGTGTGPVTSIAAGTGVAGATGAAAGPGGSATVTAGVASGTGSGHDATVSTANQTFATATVAAGTGAAHDATTTVAPVVGSAAGTGSGHDATVAPSTVGTAGVASGTGAGQGATTRVEPSPATATATGAAHQAAASTSGTVSAAVAEGTGVGHDASITVYAFVPTTTGRGWYDLLAIARRRQAQALAEVNAAPVECPNDGTALVLVNGRLVCPWDGWSPGFSPRTHRHFT